MRHSFSLAVKDASLLIRHGLLLEPAVAPRIGSFVSERCAVIVAQGLTAPRIGLLTRTPTVRLVLVPIRELTKTARAEFLPVPELGL